MELTSSAGQDTRVDMLVISLICNNLYIVCVLVICIFIDIVDIALCVCRLLLYNNFKRGVMSRVNVCFAFRMLLCFRNFVASYHRCCQHGGTLWEYFGYWIFNARYCFKYVFLCF